MDFKTILTYKTHVLNLRIVKAFKDEAHLTSLKNGYIRVKRP